jgi:hypothetical protein
VQKEAAASVQDSQVMCEILSSLDTFLAASLMFYLLGNTPSHS